MRRDIVSVKSASTSRSDIKFTESMEDSYVPECKFDIRFWKWFVNGGMSETCFGF